MSGAKLEVSASPMRIALGVALALGGVGGCATNLLVGADTEGSSGSDASAPTTVADGNGPASTASDAASGETIGETMGLEGTSSTTSSGANDDAPSSTTDPETSSTSDSASSSDSTGGQCDADNDTACEALEGCSWVGALRTCTPTTALCEPLDVEDCFATGPCLWVGDVKGAGECQPGPCSVFGNALSCEDAPSCFWTEDTCTFRPCRELAAPACDVELECGLAGPEGEPRCVPVACLDGECFDLEFTACNETLGCDFLGEPGDGTCMVLECLPCVELEEEAQCNEVAACEWDGGRMICVG